MESARWKPRTLVDPTAPSSEPFRSLRLALQLNGDRREPRAVLFTSGEAGEGKSTIATNFALVASLTHESVLIVDADMRKPTLHEALGIDRAPGLTDLAASRHGALADFVQHVGSTGHLDVLTAGQPIHRTGDLAASPRMGEIVRDAIAAYDVVVIDSPPVLAAADAAALASHPNVQVVLVVRNGTRRRTIRHAVRELKLVEADLVGVVANRLGRLSQYSYPATA
jgi:capsular exopolysaccharide synthesis family protein